MRPRLRVRADRSRCRSFFCSALGPPGRRESGWPSRCLSSRSRLTSRSRLWPAARVSSRRTRSARFTRFPSGFRASRGQGRPQAPPRHPHLVDGLLVSGQPLGQLLEQGADPLTEER